MPLDPELVSLLNNGQGSYKDGLEDANPPPPNGVYIMLLQDISAGGFDHVDKQTSVKSRVTRIRLKLKVLGDQAWGEYAFNAVFLSSMPRMMGQLGTFATASLKHPEPNLIKAYEALLAEKGKGMFEVEITRERNKTTGVEYAQINARRKIEEDQPAQQAA